MPGYKIHLTAGFILVILVELLSKTDLLNLITLICISVIYSLLPDIDIGNSKIGRTSRITLTTISTILLSIGYIKNSKELLLYGIMFLILLGVLQFTKHRAFFHTIRAGLLLSLPLILININYFLIGFLNYILHLILDKKIKL